MIYSGILAALAFSVGVATYLSRRRFSLLVFVLIVGGVVADIWSGDATVVDAGMTFGMAGLSVSALLALLFVLAPFTLLLLVGPTAHNKLYRTLAAFVVALTSVVVSHASVASIVGVSDFGMTVFSVIREYQPLIVTLVAALALIDSMAIRAHRSERGRRSK